MHGVQCALKSVGVIDDTVIKQSSAVHPGLVLEAGREGGKVAVQNWPAVCKFVLPERGGCLGSVLFSLQSGTMVGKLFLKRPDGKYFRFYRPNSVCKLYFVK